MDLKKILNIVGQPGLFLFLSQGHNSIIVESLIDKKRNTIPPNTKATSLADINVFTDKENVSLFTILQSIKEKQNSMLAIDAKTSTEKEMRDFFASILPDYDRERVYLSDIKKIIAWYNILQRNNMLDFEISEDGATDVPLLGDKSAKSGGLRNMSSSGARVSSKAAGSTKILAPRKAQ
jgi:hypothetical protein